MKIKYEIVFYSEWHCGSGLSAGADVDALVIKDKNNLPYIPGKTIKGLLREAIEVLFFFDKELKERYCREFYETFGYFNSKTDKTAKGNAFFFNAYLPQSIIPTLVVSNTQSYLYRSISSTAISNGVAKKHSLHRMETVVPCNLYGTIIADVSLGFVNEVLKAAFQYVKRMGQNRNRGLGRCAIKIIQ